MDRERAEAAQLAGAGSRTAQPSVSSPLAAGVAGVADGRRGGGAGPVRLRGAARSVAPGANATSWPAAAQGVSAASDAVTVSQRSSSGAGRGGVDQRLGKPTVTESAAGTFGISSPPAATSTPSSSTVQANR